MKAALLFALLWLGLFILAMFAVVPILWAMTEWFKWWLVYSSVTGL